MSESKYLASAEDGKEILRILESSAAKGSIELLYTRRPDAYESYMKETGEAKVFVSRDGSRTVGTCAELIREVYIDGEVCRAAYICGLKKDAEYEGSVGFGIRFIHDLWHEDVDFYYCSVVADNTEAQNMFAKGKRIISMKPLAEYKTYILNPKVKVKAPKHAFSFRQATKADIPKLLEFLNTEGRKKDLFPVIKSLDQFHKLHYSDFYLLENNDELLACAALWNQSDYKQYVVKKYRGLMKAARAVNPLLGALQYIHLPRENEPLDFPMLSFALCKNDQEDYYRILLHEIKKEIKKSYGMFVIGLPKEHFATPILERLPGISFETKLYEITFPWSEKKGRTAVPEKIYPECGLL
ncbi:MAG: hypothetical protein IJZ37_00085 [Clostridia bacterium]|nr:hypothetical protein [Clostridia bacterium]